MTLVHIKTYGCAHNMSDSEVMAQYLVKEGYQVSGFGRLAIEQDLSEPELIETADLVIYNTCTVKNPSEDKFFSQLHATNKPVIIAGCIPQAEARAEWLVQYSAIGVEQLHRVADVVEQTLQGVVVHELKKQKSLHKRDFVPTLRKNKYVAIIPILQGCLGACTYCKTKFARGTLKSYPLDDIIAQIRLAKHDGIHEMWLVSEDNGAYGLDIDLTLLDLLRAIQSIEGDFKIRLGMFNPEYAYEYRHELPEIIKDDRFYDFIHIPIQAGNNQVLEDMVRPYTREQFQEAVDLFKEKIPSISIATDIICGFPTESDDQWKETMDLVKKNTFSVINISKFYPRGGTSAAKMKLLPTEIPKARSKELSEWFAGQNYNESYVGTTVKVFFSEEGKNDTLIGKTQNYKQVVIVGNKDLLGKYALVTITHTTRDDLRGHLALVNS